jgi:hypothetical protein
MDESSEVNGGGGKESRGEESVDEQEENGNKIQLELDDLEKDDNHDDERTDEQQLLPVTDTLQVKAQHNASKTNNNTKRESFTLSPANNSFDQSKSNDSTQNVMRPFAYLTSIRIINLNLGHI